MAHCTSSFINHYGYLSQFIYELKKKEETFLANYTFPKGTMAMVVWTKIQKDFIARQTE
jgi:hypothetical protein